MKLFAKKDVDMLNGPIMKNLFIIALPVMMMNVLQSLFNVVDSTVLKNFGEPGLVGSVGVCGYLITLITGLLIGCSSGANVVIARHIGRNDKEGANRAVASSLVFALIGGIVISVIGILGARTFLIMMNVSESLIDNAVLYFRLYFLGVPLLMICDFGGAIMRSIGDSSRPMIVFTAGGVLKVLLNILFVAVFKMNIVGVALATIISWSVSTALILHAIFTSTNEMIKIHPKNLRLYKEDLKEILEVGIPAGLQQALYSVANVVISSATNKLGADATTGVSIANTFDLILYQIACAPAYAVMPFVSQNLGAGNFKRARSSMLKGMLISITLAGSLGALSAIFSGQLSSIMAENAAQIEFAKQKMIIVSSTYFIAGINLILSETLRGFRRPIIPTVATLLFMCAIRFPWALIIFPMYNNLTVLYLIWPIGWVLSIIMMLSFLIPTMRKDRWKKRFNIAS